jgi:hypothetical protein
MLRKAQTGNTLASLRAEKKLVERAIRTLEAFQKSRARINAGK